MSGNCTLENIANILKEAKSVVIVTHMRPDGDAFGSALSLSCALTALSIKNQVCVETEVPSNLRFVRGIGDVQKYPVGEYDTIIAVDCADMQRLGLLTDTFLFAPRKNVRTINVDHHISNTRYASCNYVRVCASNCINMAELIERLGVTIDKAMAEYLLMGILTDSGNFSHDDVNEETLLLASKLVKAGADIRYYNYMLFKRQPKARAKLFARVMNGIRYFHDERMALIVITKADMDECEADNGMTEGFVDFPLNVDTVEVACSLMEVKPRQYKVSLRSKEYADVNAVAGIFGGGGHVRASGCMLFGELEEVVDKLQYAVSQYLE